MWCKVSILLCFVLLSHLDGIISRPVEEENENENGLYHPPGRSRDDWINCRGLPCDEYKTADDTTLFVNVLEQEKSSGKLTPDDFVIDPEVRSEEDMNSNDILYTPDEAIDMFDEVLHGEGSRVKRKVINNNKKWWGMPIKYKFDGSHNKLQQQQINMTLKYWELQTCVRFQHIDMNTDPQEPHLMFVQSGGRIGCASYVGRINVKNNGPQPLYLDDKCFKMFGVAVHEVGHAIGLYHEHQRPVSPDYINIMKQNTYVGYHSFFTPAKSGATISNYNIPYDYNSVMHYSSRQGTRNGLPTITAKDPLFQNSMGQRVELSFLDAKAVNLHYCSATCNLADLGGLCQNGGYQDPNSCRQCRCPDGLGGRYCEKAARALDGACGGDIALNFGESAIIETPRNSRGVYNLGMECNWKITAPVGHKLTLSFTDNFMIYQKSDGICLHWLEVKNGADFAAPGPRFCGYSRPDVELSSSKENMVLAFRSHYQDIDTKSLVGFKAKVSIKGDNGKPITTSTTTTLPTTTTTQTTTTTTTPTTTTTTPTTTTTTQTTTTTRSLPNNSGGITWSEWTDCVGHGCKCGGYSKQTRHTLCNGVRCQGARAMSQEHVCDRPCEPKRDRYIYGYVGTYLYRDCYECKVPLKNVRNRCANI